MFTEEESESDLYKYKYKRTEPDSIIKWYKNNILVEVHPISTLQSDLGHKAQIIHDGDNYVILLEVINESYYLECAVIFPDVFDVLIMLPNPKEVRIE